MMDELYELCKNLKKEIRNLNTKNDISPTELERAYKAVDIIKDIKTIEAMEGYGEDDGYSGRRYYYDDDMRYSRRSMNRNGYSGNEDKEEMMRELEELKRKIESM
jgi:hypothetical protein